MWWINGNVQKYLCIIVGQNCLYQWYHRPLKKQDAASKKKMSEEE